MTDDRKPGEPELRDRFSRMFVPPELYNPEKRKDWQLEVTAEKRGPYIVELNLQHVEGLSGADIALRAIYKEAAPLAPATGCDLEDLHPLLDDLRRVAAAARGG